MRKRGAPESECGGMELVELHVGQLGSGLRGESDAVAGGDGGICGVRVDLACAARCDEDGSRGERDVARCGVRLRSAQRGPGWLGAGQIGADDAAVGDDETGDAGPLGKADALVHAGKGDERAADLGACGVAAGMQDAGQRMRAFARA